MHSSCNRYADVLWKPEYKCKFCRAWLVWQSSWRQWHMGWRLPKASGSPRCCPNCSARTPSGGRQGNKIFQSGRKNSHTSRWSNPWFAYYIVIFRLIWTEGDEQAGRLSRTVTSPLLSSLEGNRLKQSAEACGYSTHAFLQDPLQNFRFNYSCPEEKQ